MVLLFLMRVVLWLGRTAVSNMVVSTATTGRQETVIFIFGCGLRGVGMGFHCQIFSSFTRLSLGEFA